MQELLEQFAKPFDVQLPTNIVWKGKRAYVVPKRLQEVAERIKADPFSLGLPLGEVTSKGFKPSFALLDLCKDTNNKITIQNEAEWLFTCGRDIFPEKVMDKGELRDTFLVVNEQGFVLGLAKKEQKGKNLIYKNLLDRGDFLRREEKRKKKRWVQKMN